MGVTRYDDLYSGCRWIKIKPVTVVQNTECDTSGRNKFNPGQVCGPLTAIHITAYGNDRCHADQGIQDFRSTDVSGMNDGVDAGKELRYLRVQLAMGVRDNAQLQVLLLVQTEIGAGRDAEFPFQAVLGAILANISK